MIETPDQSAAIADVLAERRRQVEMEGWTAEHDDEHDMGELALASASYAINGAEWEHGTSTSAMRLMPPDVWPWDDSWWKPQSQRRDLVRAAALLIAEIERIDRAALRSEGAAG